MTTAQTEVDAPPIVNIVGEKVALGPLRRDLLPTFQRWYNDFSVRRTFGWPDPWTLDQVTAFYDRDRENEHSVFFTLYERAAWTPIGFTYLEEIDWRSRKAEFGILIGEAAGRGRGKGYGTEATMLTLDYAFTALGLHNVMLRVYAYNLIAKRVYENVGFCEFGRRHESKFMGGRLWDEVFMEYLAPWFASPVLARILAPDMARDEGRDSSTESG